MGRVFVLLDERVAQEQCFFSSRVFFNSSLKNIYPSSPSEALSLDKMYKFDLRIDNFTNEFVHLNLRSTGGLARFQLMVSVIDFYDIAS